MGNKLTVAQRWTAELRDLPIEEQVGRLVLNDDLDYIYLVCENTADELCSLLKKKEELHGLEIRVTDRLCREYFPHGYREYPGHGVEIRLPTPPGSLMLACTTCDSVALIDTDRARNVGFVLKI